MSRIRRLDPQTVEQIRAGEVIERPGSVVKELVENAIDAGAQTIRVQIAEGGIRDITVHDDGRGMSPEDALLAVQRHTTSKIRRSSDLFGLSTLGFRGEALASIAAVSRLELVSRTADALEGTCIRAAGSEPAESAPVAASQGTTVSVRHLFFNTPPRRAFLKSPVAEGNYVEEVLVGLAVSRPGLRFVFSRDRRLVFDAVAHTGPQALARRAGAVLGQAWATSLVLDEDGYRRWRRRPARHPRPARAHQSHPHGSVLLCQRPPGQKRAAVFGAEPSLRRVGGGQTFSGLRAVCERAAARA